MGDPFQFSGRPQLRSNPEHTHPKPESYMHPLQGGLKVQANRYAGVTRPVSFQA